MKKFPTTSSTPPQKFSSALILQQWIPPIVIPVHESVCHLSDSYDSAQPIPFS
jgi:hypothetical protein